MKTGTDSALEACIVVTLLPTGEAMIVVDSSPCRALIRAVREGGPGTEAVIATATRPPIRGRRAAKLGPRWGEWMIEAYAVEDADPTR